MESAGETVNRILLADIVPATIELMDNTTLNTIEEAMQLGLPITAEAMLIIEVDGSDETQVLADIESIAEIARANGATEVKVAQNEQERAHLWQARRSISPSLARRRPNKLGEDISVPRSKIPETIRRIKAISQKYNLPIAVFGHAGDGNLHPNILFDRRDPDEWERVQLITKELFSTAVELGGTLSGEHGVGTLKCRIWIWNRFRCRLVMKAIRTPWIPLAFSIRAEVRLARDSSLNRLAPSNQRRLPTYVGIVVHFREMCAIVNQVGSSLYRDQK